MTQRGSSTSQIGSLMNQITDTLKSEASIPTESSPTSEIGPSTPHLANNANAIPMHSGAAGAVAKPIDLGVHQAQTVAERDEALLRSVTQLVGSPLVEVSRSWWAEKSFDEYCSQLVGYRLEHPVDEERLAEARALIAEVSRPAAAQDVMPMVLAIAETLPSHDRTDGEAWLELVLSVIDDMPLDVIEESLKAIVMREKWRPTPAEVREECLRRGERRRGLVRLQEAPTPSAKENTKTEPPEPTTLDVIDAMPKTPANAHWKAMYPVLLKAVGNEPSFPNWMRDLIPHADDGETLVLAAPDEWTADNVATRFKAVIERELNRKVILEVHGYATARRNERWSKRAIQ